MIIGGLQKTSLIDFPKKISAIIFTQGCNFRCGYCHNPELLIKQSSEYDDEKIFEFLKTRVGKLDGVVITGGEPTLHKDLKEFIKRIKALNFDIKLDTNGTNPKMISELLNEKLLDYIAMDIKAPIEKYSEITNAGISSEDIKESIKLIKSSNILYEFRTTVLKELLTYDDLDEIGELLKGSEKYYLQKFVSTKIYDDKLKNAKNYTDEELERIANRLREKIKYVGIR